MSSSGTVSQATCDRMPTATAGQEACRGEARQASTLASVTACTASAAARPRRVAQQAHVSRHQNSGQVAAAAADSSARSHGPSAPLQALC